MQAGRDVSLGTCCCGHAPMPPSRDRHPWAVLAGFDRSVEVIRREGTPAEIVPAVGDAIRVALTFPFVGSLGEAVWTTFDPPLAALNGYDEHPEALAGFRLVRIRLETLLPVAVPRGASATATVLDVLDPMTLMITPPSDGDLGPVEPMGLRPASAVCGPLRRTDVNFEGDIGGWTLVHVGERGATLLAYGRWGAHEDEVVAGHRPLAPAELARIAPGPEAAAERRPRRAGVAGWCLAAALLLGATATADAQQARLSPTLAKTRLVTAEVSAVGCATQGQTEDLPAPELPARVEVSVPASAVGRLASYRAASGMSVLAPIGWTCAGFSGSDGLTLVAAPAGTDLSWPRPPMGPAVVRLFVDSGTSGRFRVAEVAARALPAFRAFARRVAAEGGDPALVFAPYPRDRLTRVGADTVLYRTPARTEGLGTLNLSPGRAPVTGFARIGGGSRAPTLTYLAIRLDPQNETDDAAILAQALAPEPPAGRP